MTLSHPKSLERAAEEGRLGEEYEGVEEAEENAREEDEGELATARLDDGRLAVAEEDGDDKGGQGHAEHGDGDGDEGVGRVPFHIAQLQVKAAHLVGPGPATFAAVEALGLIEDVLVGTAGRADPATLVARLRDLTLTHAAGARADGLGNAHQLAEGVQEGVVLVLVLVGGAEGRTPNHRRPHQLAARHLEEAKVDLLLLQIEVLVAPFAHLLVF